MSKYTLTLDSSQLSTIYSCMQKWDWSQNKKLYKKTDEGGEYPLSQAILGGTYGHKLFEVYDTVLMRTGKPLDAFHVLCDENQWLTDNHLVFETSEKVESFLSEMSQLDPARKKLVLSRVIGSITRYAGQIYSVLGVEEGFSYPLYEDDNNLFILEGRFDCRIHFQEKEYWLDHKFQDAARPLYRKMIQFRNYTMVSGCNTGMINYVRLTQSENPQTYQRDLTPFSAAELELWKLELINKYFEVKDYLLYPNHSKKDPRNRVACGHYEYDQCWYTQLCDETQPDLVQIRIDQNFGVREKMWRPWD